MHATEALGRLGLPTHSLPSKASIRAAYKRKILESHPDKNESVDTTKEAQILNEARDVLFRLCEERGSQEERLRMQRETEELDKAKKQREEEDARFKKQREDEEAAAQRQWEEEQARAQKLWEEEQARAHKLWEEEQARAQKLRAEGARARNQRAEEERVRQQREERQARSHKLREDAKARAKKQMEEEDENRSGRRAGSKKHGAEEEQADVRKKRPRLPVMPTADVLAFLEEMRVFVESKFKAVEAWGNHVYSKSILDLFISSRDKETSDAEVNVFIKRCPSVVLAAFPHAKQIKHKNQRAYLYIALN